MILRSRSIELGELTGRKGGVRAVLENQLIAAKHRIRWPGGLRFVDLVVGVNVH